MNQIVIVGNGFDLAHDLKTDYKSLLLWVTKKAIETASNNIGNWTDYLFFRVKQRGKFRDDRLEKILNCQTIDEIKQDSNISWLRRGGTTVFSSIDGVIYGLDDPIEPIVIQVNGYLVNKIFDHLSLSDWVDIEKLYFQSLIEVLDSTDLNREKEIEDINRELESIKKSLIDYLKLIISEFSLSEFKENCPDRFKRLNELIIESPLRKPSLIGDESNEVLFINFNYTNLIEDYINFSWPDSPNFKVLNIHGSLGDEPSKIVFGYGHIQNSEYLKIKQSNIFMARKNLKRDIYRVWGNDDKLNSFIDKSPFIVKILGHSCGVSDGAILQRIFESKNCYKILISHRGEGDFRSKLSSILLHSENDDHVAEKIYKMIPSLMFPSIV